MKNISYLGCYNNMRRSRRRDLSLTGFTVIELLTSIFIIAILVTMLSVVFNQGIKAYRQADEIIDITNKAQIFFGQICSELPGAVVSENPSVSFKGTSTNIYFMAPWDNSSDIELCEFGYNFVGTEIKRHFITADAGASFEYPTSAVDYSTGGENLFVDLESGSSVQFKYDGSSTWNSHTSLPPSLPQIVELKIVMKDSRNVNYTFTTRVFLPGSM